MQALTNEAFWDEYWAGIQLPALLEPAQVQWHFALTQIFQRILRYDPTLTLLEIGCAPGRWLVWFNRTLGYKIVGCDTSPKGVQLTQDNLRLNAVSGTLCHADLMSDDLPLHTFDVVLSIGVIEHFQDPSPIIARHIELLKPGGRLILEVPNMAGAINHLLLRLAGMNDFLAVHNLAVMNRYFFKSVARDFQLDIECLTFAGGFDPGIVVFNYPYPTRGKRKIAIELLRRRHFVLFPLWTLERSFRRLPKSWLTRWNAPSFSHLLVGIYRIPA